MPKNYSGHQKFDLMNFKPGDNNGSHLSEVFSREFRLKQRVILNRFVTESLIRPQLLEIDLQYLFSFMQLDQGIIKQNPANNYRV